MKKPNHIVIIGGTACGPKAAARARRCDPQASITLIEQGKHLSTASCGLPYYVSGVIKRQRDLQGRRPEYFRQVLNLEVRTNTRALSIDRAAHQVELFDLRRNRTAFMGYDKLVLATGSIPAVPPLEGVGLGGIFTLTRIEDALNLRHLVAARPIKRAVVIGAGLMRSPW
jgi:NADPH-dependent 2,4-dienoyl-CoA reductase/sulfur reductase-like enzyme